MRYAIIQGGVVVNAVAAKADFATSQGWVEMPTHVAPGWLYDGRQFTPPPPPPPPPPPEGVTMRQARLALLKKGLLTQVDAAIESMTDEIQRAAARIEWEYAQSVDRKSALIKQIAPALNLSDEQVDDLFRFAELL